MKLNFKKIFTFLILVFVFIFMIVLNNNASLVTDDFIYHFVFTNRLPTNSTKLITNFFELFPSMANHWRLWGGRVVDHFLLQFSFIMGLWFFNIVNSLMFVLLGILIYKHIKNDNNNINVLLLVLIYAVIFAFVPQPGSTIIWKSGSANYLWSSVIILSVTLQFKNHYEGKFIKDSFVSDTLFFIIGIITGCCNENAGCALIVTIILFIIFNKLKHKEIPQWMILNLVGTILGYAFLMAAPGNYIRADKMYSGVDYGVTSLLEYVVKITRLTYNYLKVLIISLIATSVLLFTKRKKIIDYINVYGIQIIFVIFSLISIYSLVMSPAYPERCWMFAFVYLTIVVGINIMYLINNDKYKALYNKFFIIITIVTSLNSISLYNEAYYDIINTKECIDDQVLQIKSQLKEGKRDVAVHGIPSSVGKYNPFTYNGYLTYNSDSWTNRWIAEYYGADSIVAED